MSEESAEYGRHIVKCPTEYSLCTGCCSCEMVCSLVHEEYVSPTNKRIFLIPGPIKTSLHELAICQQCADRPCYEACPKKGAAMRVDEETGVVWIDEAECIGCGLCQRACKFTPSRINLVKSKNKDERKAKKCDLCRGRAEGPACVQWCPAACLAVSDGEIPWQSGAWKAPTITNVYVGSMRAAEEGEEK